MDSDCMFPTKHGLCGLTLAVLYCLNAVSQLTLICLLTTFRFSCFQLEWRFKQKTKKKC